MSVCHPSSRSNPVKTTTTSGRRRSFVATAILSLVAASAVVAGSTSPAVADIKPTCAGAKTQVVDVTRSFRNLADFGVDGHVWALDSFEDRLRIWRVGTDRYCVRRDMEGTFETFAGPSPNLTGTVDEGISGTFTGTVIFTNTADSCRRSPCPVTSASSTRAVRKMDRALRLCPPLLISTSRTGPGRSDSSGAKPSTTAARTARSFRMPTATSATSPADEGMPSSFPTVCSPEHAHRQERAPSGSRSSARRAQGGVGRSRRQARHSVGVLGYSHSWKWSRPGPPMQWSVPIPPIR